MLIAFVAKATCRCAREGSEFESSGGSAPVNSLYDLASLWTIITIISTYVSILEAKGLSTRLQCQRTHILHIHHTCA